MNEEKREDDPQTNEVKPVFTPLFVELTGARERIATAAMAAIISSDPTQTFSEDRVAEWSIRMADRLIQELNK